MNDTVAELRSSESLLPHDVAVAVIEAETVPPRRPISAISAHDFQDYRPEWGFGIDRKKTAEKLRELAAAVDAGTILLQRVQLTSEGQRADYTRSALILEYVAKIKVVEY